MKGLYEILTEKKWMVAPEFVHGIKKIMEQNLNTHAIFTKPKKNMGFVKLKAEDGFVYPEEYQISEDGSEVRGRWTLEEGTQKFPFVSVLTIDGPITRNGGGCSYGSIDHRNMLIEAAKHPLCCGHVFIINTPGGSAWAKNDYEQAIDYAHSLGQPVLAFIDGLCASAGMYLASLCDERYYMHPKDEIGCIGVMAAFYTEANGSENKYTNETYHELYDPESFDKNRAYRAIANNGDEEDLVKELTALGEEFRSDVKKACPNAEDIHLHGNVFEAKSVEGIFVDGQSDFLGVVQRAFKLFRGEELYIHREKTDIDEKQDSDANTENNEILKNINMKDYPLINAVCDLKEGDIVVNKDGAFMNVSLLDKIEDKLASLEKENSTAKETISEKEKSLQDMEKQTEDLESQNKAKDVALSQIQNKYDKEMNESKEQESALSDENSKLKEHNQQMSEQIAELKQMIADMEAQIKELSNDVGSEVNAGAAPETNGEGAKIQGLREFCPDNYKTNAERKAAFERFKRGE